MTLLHQAAQKAVEAPEYVGWQFRYVFEDQNDRRGSWGCVLDGIRTMPNNHRPYDADRPGRRCRYEVRDVFAGPVGGGPPALQQQEVPREPVALADAAWVRRLRETAKHLRENSLSLAKYPGMSDEARARELAALYIGEIAELFEAKRTAASPTTTQQQEAGLTQREIELLREIRFNFGGVGALSTEWRDEACNLLSKIEQNASGAALPDGGRDGHD